MRCNKTFYMHYKFSLSLNYISERIKIICIGFSFDML